MHEGGRRRGLIKTGIGTLEITSTSNSYSGATTVSVGSLRLGASNVLPDTTNVIIAAALDVAAGVTESTGTGTLDVTNAVSTINLGSGASRLAFADSSGVDWTGGTLNITVTFAPGNGVDPSSQRRVRGQSYWLSFLCKTLSFSVSSRFIPALFRTRFTAQPVRLECLFPDRAA